MSLAAMLPSEEYQVSEVINEAQIEADARQKSMPFFLISFFSLTMSVFIIYGSYKVITLDRLPVIGTFRSIGATQKAVTGILLLESMLYGVIGGLMGFSCRHIGLEIDPAGDGRIYFAGDRDSRGDFSVQYSFILCSGSDCVLTLCMASCASGKPSAHQRCGTWKCGGKNCPRRFIVMGGVILFAVSMILPKLASGKMLYPAGGFSLLGLITATILMVPLLTNLICWGLEYLLGAVLGNEGRLAARNMRDNKNVGQNITLLFISISAVIAITVVGNFVTTYVGDVFRDAELQGFADGYMEPQFVERVKNMEGIEKVLPLHVYKDQMQADGRTLSRLEATDDLDCYSSMMGLQYTEKGMKEQAVSAFAGQRAILLSESCMERMGFLAGDTISLTGDTGENEYRIAGSFKSRATDVEAVIPSSYAVVDFGASAYDFLAYTAADPEAIMIQIRSLFGETANWSRTVEEFNEDALSTVSAFLQPMHSLTYFILLMAAVGVINNLLINYMQKRRSTAMYKSVGLSNRQNVKMTLIEGFVSGLIGAVIAIFVSYMEIKTIFLVAGPKIAMAPKLDAVTFLTAGAMGVLVTLIGSVVPIIKSRRMKLVEEIKFE